MSGTFRLDYARKRLCLSFEVAASKEENKDVLLKLAKEGLAKAHGRDGGLSRVFIYVRETLTMYSVAAYASCRENGNQLECIHFLESMLECILNGVKTFLEEHFIPAFEDEADTIEPLGPKANEVYVKALKALRDKVDDSAEGHESEQKQVAKGNLLHT